LRHSPRVTESTSQSIAELGHLGDEQTQRTPHIRGLPTRVNHATKIILSLISLGRRFPAGQLSLCAVICRRVDTEDVSRDSRNDTRRRLVETRADVTVTSRRSAPPISDRLPHDDFGYNWH